MGTEDVKVARIARDIIAIMRMRRFSRARMRY